MASKSVQECYVEGPDAAGAAVTAQPNVMGWKDGSGFAQHVSAANPLPVAIASGAAVTQDVNLKQVNGTTVSQGNGVAGNGCQRVTIASDNSAILTSAANTTATLLASTTLTAATTVSHAAVTGLGLYKQAEIALDVTAAGVLAADTLDVYIDTLVGGKLVNCVHFPQVLGDGGALSFVAVLDPGGSPGSACIATTSDAAANAVRPTLFGTTLVVRTVVVDGGGASQTFTLSVTATLKA